VKVESGRWRRRSRRVALASAAGGRSRVGAENSVTAFETSRRLVTNGAGESGASVRACPAWKMPRHAGYVVPTFANSFVSDRVPDLRPWLSAPTLNP
jgi:hypothetical protein